MLSNVFTNIHKSDYPRFAYFCKASHPRTVDHHVLRIGHHYRMEHEATELSERVGSRLLLAISQAGLTQADLCRALDWLTPQTLNSWIKGHRMLPLEKAMRLAPILGCTAAYLLTLEDHIGDQRERALIDLYRGSDERGKGTILRVAESESQSSLPDGEHHSNAA